MSHYTLTVKIHAACLAEHGGNVDSALATMMAPYQEEPEDPRFLAFEDKEGEYRKQWEEGSTKRVRTPTGELLLPWDDRFRVPGAFGIGSNTHRVPDDCVRVDVPFRETYPDFETFCQDWHSSKRDPKTGRHGYWRNPNAKWDWYVIGGRWSGFYPVKHTAAVRVNEPNEHTAPLTSDVVTVGDIDFSRVTRDMLDRADTYYADYMRWLECPTNDFDSPRSKALVIGLCRVVEGPATAGDGEVAIPWSKFTRLDDERQTWTDVLKVLSRETFLAEYLDHFCNITTYAALDGDGWHAPGEMGWFGCSSDTPDTKSAFVQTFLEKFVRNSAPDDTLVVVDCHI